MNPMIKDLLAILGTIMLGGLILFAIVGAYEVIKEGISKVKWQYKYKHRFDKPPTAACYCKDCKKHGTEQNRCYKFDGWYTADNWFCWDADPLERDPDVPKQSN